MAETLGTALATNTQDFSESDDEILDNFAEGPQPGDPPPENTHDDGVPMGLGGEKGKQSEPASSTLEADIVNGTTPGEVSPPDSATPSGEKGEVDSEVIPESEEPELPAILLQMAGYASAEDATKDGLGSFEALNAFVRGRGQLLEGDASAPNTTPSKEEVQLEQPEGDIKPFELPADKMELLDEDLQDVLKQMNEHYQKELGQVRSVESQRQAEIARRQQDAEVDAFDKAVTQLGGDWKDVFGEGSGVELSEQGQRDPAAMTNFNHRAMLYDAVQAVREVNAKRGFKQMDLTQEIQFALMQRYPEQFQKTVSGNSRSRNGVTASRPTQRKTPPKGQNQATLAAVNRMLSKKGRPGLDMGEPDELDGEI